MDPVDVKTSICINFNKKNNKESPKSKIDHNVRISRYKNILQKAMFQIGLRFL